MSANAGGIAALLDLDATGFVRELQKSAQELEAFSKHMKKLANDFAMVGAAVGALAFGSLKAVADYSSGAARTLQAFKEASLTLGNQIAVLAAPAVLQFAKNIRQLADWIAGLSPHTKEMIVNAAKLAIEIGGAAVVFARLMEVVHGLSGLFSVLAGVVAAIGAGPLAVIVVVLGALVVAGAVLRKAWIENWGGMRQIVADVIADISTWWASFATFFADLWSHVVEGFGVNVKTMLGLFFLVEEKLGRMSGSDVKLATGLAGSAIDAGVRAASSPMAIQGLVLSAATEVKTGAHTIVKDLTDAFKGLGDKILNSLGLGPNNGHAAGISEYDLTVNKQPKLLDSMPGGQGQMDQVAANAYTLSQRYGVDGSNAARMNGGATSSATPGMQTGVAMSFEDTIKLIKDHMIEAWDAGDFKGAVKGFTDMILTDLTSVEQIGNALKTAGSAFTAATGKLGATINAGIQGGQSGGIWGALIAVIMQFVTQAKGFTQIMNIGNGQFQMALNDMAHGLGNLFKGLAPFMGAIEQIASVIHGVLDPILSLIGSLLKGIAPLFATLGLVLQPLASIFQIIGGVLENTLAPAFQSMGPILFAVDEILMAVQLSFQYIKLGLDDFLDGIYKTFGINGGSNQDAVNADNAAIYGPNGTIQKMKDMATNELAGLESGTNRTLTGGIDGLNQASADAADKLGQLGNTATSVSEQLLNVPNGYKVAMDRFLATQTASSGVSSTVSSPFSTIGGSDARQRFLATGNRAPRGIFAKPK